ncbi:FAD-dependent pyridine nucleotide-disulfide oxidoreductase [Cellulomonas flavigena DSM 20109]|uniref:FAD-dependent pyridine nucleotide-disulfide oxidoreductase n=2 Tax=Cellulomonas flavigena TaxID=1711 RepID=D5UKK7_CELFN|nr:FAD-dependent pyridine nucleotide-disulfide oxidoreductase [Cellulomonas flavigena DSM 20109]
MRASTVGGMSQSSTASVDAARPTGELMPAPAGKPRKVPRVVVLGGGTVGLYSARRLRRRLGKREAAIVVVDPRPYMTYAPFLPEAAAGSIDPRNVVAPHRRALKNVDVLQGHVTQIEHANRRVQITPIEGDSYWVTYDHLVVGLGSVARTLPIPGLAEQGIGFKNVEEAIALRNHVLGRIDVAASTWDPELRRKMLTFVFVGGGFAGIEALAEVEDMARYAVRKYKQIEPEELRFVLVEGSPRILPEVSEELGGYTLEQLRKRDIEIFLSTFLSSCVDGRIVLSNGTEFDAETVVWTAGVKANPVLQQSDLPLDHMGRVICNATLQVTDEDGTVVADAWAAGDCAAVPDLYNPGKFCPPNAQHALREGNHIGDNLALVLRSAQPTEYKHRNVGAVASLGMYKGVAQMFGRIKVRGFLAWVLHRTYHVFAMPTFNRKLRIAAGWTGSVLLRREVVALGSLHDPRAEFRAASAPPKPKVEQVSQATAPTDGASGGESLPPYKAEKDSPAAKEQARKA